MGGRMSRDKGARGERHVVHVLQEAGLAGERIPLSGAAGGSFVGDVLCPVLGRDRVFEVKTHATGFSRLYTWLATHYGLVVRQNRCEALVVMRLKDFAELAIAADRNRLKEVA